MMWPTDAFTVYRAPRYFLMVFAFAGDSTTTSVLPLPPSAFFARDDFFATFGSAALVSSLSASTFFAREDFFATFGSAALVSSLSASLAFVFRDVLRAFVAFFATLLSVIVSSGWR